MELRHVSLAYEARCSSLELSLLASLVGPEGLEPPTSGLRIQRAPICATDPQTFLYEITESALSVVYLAPINFRRILPPYLAIGSNSELLRTL